LCNVLATASSGTCAEAQVSDAESGWLFYERLAFFDGLEPPFWIEDTSIWTEVIDICLLLAAVNSL
jgi:hypothetical protein